jgi:hypothetical protein
VKIEKNEMQAVAAVDALAAPAPRVDLYAGIHKALRALMADTLLALGRMDPDDGLDLAEATDRVLLLLQSCASHLHHENEFVHAALEARAAGSSERIAHEHGDHLAHIAQLGQAVAELRAAPAASRAALSHALYQQLALFIAHNFEHMHVEETAHNAVLWARYTDAELIAIEQALVASIPPEEMMSTVRWMVPFMNPAARAVMLGGMQAHAPAPAFAAVLEVVRPHLTQREWHKLATQLGLATD